MTSKEIKNYFESTANRDTRNDLKLAVSLVFEEKVAIDCGCGAGSDIAYLRSCGFSVYAFDIEKESIARCQDRFKDDPAVHLSLAAFHTYKYPNASLIVADASLFFCPRDKFAEVWYRITNALLPGGIFVGSFLGPNDSMAGPEFNKKSYWPQVLVFNKEQVIQLFRDYEIKSFIEHQSSGVSHDGEQHQWHLFSVVARKICETVE